MCSDLPEPRGYYLEPGYIYCLPEPATVHTVVGSSVSVCLWDAELRIGAMNHFLYPAARTPDRATPQYGNVATAELIRMMLECGSRKEDLRAQIVGGASPEPGPGLSLGQRNTNAARRVLIKTGLLIVSEDIGGHMGRKVAFDTRSGHLMVLKVHQLRQDDWNGPPGNW